MQSVLSVIIQVHLVGSSAFEEAAVHEILDDWFTARVDVFVAIVSVVSDLRMVPLVRWFLLNESVLWL